MTNLERDKIMSNEKSKDEIINDLELKLKEAVCGEHFANSRMAAQERNFNDAYAKLEGVVVGLREAIKYLCIFSSSGEMLFCPNCGELDKGVHDESCIVGKVLLSSVECMKPMEALKARKSELEEELKQTNEKIQNLCKRVNVVVRWSWEKDERISACNNRINELCSALSLANSMILSGEHHTEQSEFTIKKALRGE